MKYTALYSGGKDSTALCHHLQKQGKLDKAIFIDTGISAPDLVDFVLKAPWPVEVWKTNIWFDWIVATYGFARPYSHSWYFNYLKARALRQFRSRNKGEEFILASGVRSLESSRRFRNTQNRGEIDGMKIDAPIIDWSTEQVWKYLQKNDLEISPCYKTMHYSGDCFCGAFAEKNELEMLDIFYPEVAERLKKLEDRYGGTWGNAKVPNRKGIRCECNEV